MFRKIGFGVLLLLFLTAGAALADYSYSTGYYYHIWSSSERTCYIYDCSPSVAASTILEIPQTVNGYTVIGISGGSFLHKNTSIQKVIFPSTLKSLGSGAFRECTNLRSVTFTGNRLECNTNVFADCTSLEYVYGTENFVDFYWQDGFLGNCVSLKHFIVPKSLNRFSAGCKWFEGCSSLTLELQNGMTEICDNFLTDTPGIKEIIVPSSVVKIGNNCMAGLKTTTIHVKGYVNSIGTGSLLKCRKMYVRRDSELFNYCKANRISCSQIVSKPLILPSMLTAISEEAFEGLSVEEITLGNAVKSIGKSAFANCKNLILLNLPDGVQIEEGAFSGCKQLTLICTKNSSGHAYAKENGIPYIIR